ncbi:hypothetical protein Bca4012_041038 [Brassica carinata]
MKRRRRFGERFPRRNTIAAAYRPCSDTEPLEKEILPKSHVTTPSSSIAKQEEEEEEARDDQPQPNT